jgi:hypothetical protein
MLNGYAFTRCAAGLGLIIGLQGGSAAPAANGQIGVQSRAAIQITVRVMPRFTVNGSNHPLTVGRIGNAEALNFSTNMTGLRFDVIAASRAPERADTPTAAGRSAAFQHLSKPSLFLVVPD